MQSALNSSAAARNEPEAIIVSVSTNTLTAATAPLTPGPRTRPARSTTTSAFPGHVFSQMADVIGANRREQADALAHRPHDPMPKQGRRKHRQQIQPAGGDQPGEIQMQRVLAQFIEGMPERAMNAPDQQRDDRKLDRRDKPFALLGGHGGRRMRWKGVGIGDFSRCKFNRRSHVAVNARSPLLRRRSPLYNTAVAALLPPN